MVIEEDPLKEDRKDEERELFGSWFFLAGRLTPCNNEARFGYHTSGYHFRLVHDAFLTALAPFPAWLSSVFGYRSFNLPFSSWMRFDRIAWFATAVILFGGGLARLARGELPAEPMEIGFEPQFFIDDRIVDNRWSFKMKTEEVVRVFHPPTKHPANPLLVGDGGYVSALREPDSGLFRLWYQTHAHDAAKNRSNYAIGYAESADGIRWQRPELGLYEWNGNTANNIVWRGHADARASGHQILVVPPEARQGYRYLMAYHTSGGKRGENGIHVVGSMDGIHWMKKSDHQLVELASDTVNSIIYQPSRREYLLYCRPKDRYLSGQTGILDSGESRRIARLKGNSLWTRWDASPQTILLPDELDLAHGFNRFYGMPARQYAGITFGFLWDFKLNSDVWTELTWSRDGEQFHRLPARPRLIDLGPLHAWDDGMVFGSPDWIEVDDEWWLYYAGWDGPHGTAERTGSIGLATMRKEGFVSLRGPAGGGVVCTRLVRWPGGDLSFNGKALHGSILVRVSDAHRRPIAGFDYDDGDAFRGDDVAHRYRWHGRSLDTMTGKAIRLEFQLKGADLFTFRAMEVE